MTASTHPVRRAQPSDAQPLADFAARIFADTFGPDNRPENVATHVARSFGHAQQARELADPDFVTLVIDGPEGLAAYAQVRRASPPSCVSSASPVELYRFYVDRPWQGQGLAHRLMAAVKAAASGLGGRSIWLCVWERNPRAIAFYQKSGFHEVGAATFILGTERQTDRVLVALVPTAPTP